MKIQIMGAGALGCLFGALIQNAGFEVVFVARGEQYKALTKSLRVSGLVELEMEVNAVRKPENADITFVTVKAYDTESAGKQLAEVDPGIVCSLQNGIGNEEILQKYCRRVLGGVTSYGANLVTFGHIRYAGEGYTYVGEMNGEISEDAETVANILRNSGIRAEAVSDITFRLWAKAVVNAAINPVTALCKVKNGRIIEDLNLWEVAREVAREGEEVMRRMGFEFDAVSEVRKVAEMTAENRSSMLQDIERGKKTEVDFINGAIVKKGEDLGIDCKTNRILTLLIKGAEHGDS
jgi:2-dehydropantoate 2-reductase